MNVSGRRGTMACACLLAFGFTHACDKDEDRSSDTGTDNSDTSAETGIPCDDFVECTIDECDPVTGLPVNTPDDSLCDDGQFCNGTETCNALAGCQPGDAVVLSDSIECTVDYCDEETDTVMHVSQDVICDDDLYCTGSETCDVDLGCQVGTDPVVDDGIACTVESCDEARDMVVVTPSNALCDDSEPCNGVETCDLETGCMAGTPLADGETCGIDMICLSEVCELSICGDDFIDPLMGEDCEDGNDVPLDGCDACSFSTTCDLTGTITLNATTLTHSATGTTTTSDSSAYVGYCGGYRGHEHLYELNVESPMSNVEISTSGSSFDTVAYLRGGPGACDGYEMMCDDDGGEGFSLLDTGCLDAGYYYAFVDGYDETTYGTYNLDLAATPLVDPSRVVTLSASSPTFSGGGDFSVMAPSATDSWNCWAGGQEDAWKVTLTDPMVSVAAQLEEGSIGLALHARTTACDEQTELDCDEGYTRVAIETGCLDPGTYYFFADTNYVTPGGNYTLDIEGLTLADAVGGRTVSLDATTTNFTTTSATAAGTSFFESPGCGGSGPEHVYEITLGTDVTGLQVDVTGDLWYPTVTLRRDLCDECDVACSPAWSYESMLYTQCLPAGTYYLIVDGAGTTDHGDYSIDITAPPVATGESCSPPWEIHQTLTLDASTPRIVIDDSTSNSVIGTRAGYCAESDYEPEEHIYEVQIQGNFYGIEFSTAFSSFDTVLYTTEDLCNDWYWDCNDDEWSISPQSYLWMECPPPGTLYVIVDGNSIGDAGPYHLEIEGIPILPGEPCFNPE